MTDQPIHGVADVRHHCDRVAALGPDATSLEVIKGTDLNIATVRRRAGARLGTPSGC